MNYNKEAKELSLIEAAGQSRILNIYVQMAFVFIDTYLIVCLAISYVCGKHVIMKQKQFI